MTSVCYDVLSSFRSRKPPKHAAEVAFFAQPNSFCVLRLDAVTLSSSSGERHFDNNEQDFYKVPPCFAEARRAYQRGPVTVERRSGGVWRSQASGSAVWNEAATASPECSMPISGQSKHEHKCTTNGTSLSRASNELKKTQQRAAALRSQGASY